MKSDVLSIKTHLQFEFTIKRIIMSVVIGVIALIFFFTLRFPWWVFCSSIHENRA